MKPLTEQAHTVHHILQKSNLTIVSSSSFCVVFFMNNKQSTELKYKQRKKRAKWEPGLCGFFSQPQSVWRDRRQSGNGGRDLWRRRRRISIFAKPPSTSSCAPLRIPSVTTPFLYWYVVFNNSLSECLICRIWRKQSLHLLAEAGAWEQWVSISVNSYYMLTDHLSFFRLYHPTPLQVLQIQNKQTCQLVFGSLLFLSVFKWNRALHLTVINFFNMMQHNLDFKFPLTVMLKISAHWFGLSLLLYFFSMVHRSII